MSKMKKKDVRGSMRMNVMCVVCVVVVAVSLQFAEASSVGAAPRQSAYAKSGTSETSETATVASDSTSVMTRQESLLRMLDTGAADSPEETMPLFNGWGPFRSSYVIINNMRGLPGRYDSSRRAYTYTKHTYT